MYPGYSPADHVYGRAAEEFGREWQLAKQHGVEFKSSKNGPEYKFGQSRIGKKVDLSTLPAGSKEVDGSNSLPSDTIAQVKNNTGEGQAFASDDNAFFIIDTNPAPVNTAVPSHSPLKRFADQEPGKESKKVKVKYRPSHITTKQERIETEDITREVDERIREKDARRKAEISRKRKHGVEKELAATSKYPEAMEIDGETQSEPELEVAKLKKSKKSDSEQEGSLPVESNYSDAADAEKAGDKRQKKSKKKKKEKKKKNINNNNNNSNE